MKTIIVQLSILCAISAQGILTTPHDANPNQAPPCTATRTANCTPKTDASGNLNVGGTLLPGTEAIALAQGMDVPATLAPTLITITGTYTAWQVLQYPDSDGDYSATFHYSIPDCNSRSLRIKWAASAAATGNVVWQVSTTFGLLGATWDTAWNTAQTVTSAAPAATESVHAVISSITMTGCSVTSGPAELFVRVLRNRTHASDTINQAINLREVVIAK